LTIPACRRSISDGAVPKQDGPTADTLDRLTEVFREHGFEGASLSLISEATGLGKGSLYHAFPGGKAEMAEAVLARIDEWFEHAVFVPLRGGDPPDAAIRAMMRSVDRYFRSGHRTCLVGSFALGNARDRFSARIGGYFTAWRDALASVLVRAGCPAAEAAALAEDAVGGIQGALVAARAFADPSVFGRVAARIEARLLAAINAA
jgi:TetR/AcrR family transcriptional regulator, lmrAB and yxaGH operons repressor